VLSLVGRAHADVGPALDDVEIIAAVREGDDSAAIALYRRARPQVEKTILSVLGRRDCDHDDLVQVSFVMLVRSMASFRGECSLDTWTSRITARALFKHLRRRSSDARVFDRSADVADMTSSAPDAEQASVARSTARRVRRHLDAMDPNKAWTIVLHDVCGHDLREIAEITGCSVAAAQTRLSRGRSELHERIALDPELADELTWRGPRR
jgi:RNA polymerase sigma-70 factor (ECF subfamily)